MSPPPVVVREQEQEEESKQEEESEVQETTLWRRGKPLKKKQYPGQGKVDDRKHPPKSKVDDRKHPPGGGGNGGGRGVGGVGGGDVRGDGRTDDGGAHPHKSKVDDRKHPPGGGGDGGSRDVGGVSGGDVRGDGHTDDGGAHPLKSKGDDRKHPPGSAAKKVIFGIAEDNVCYAEGVVAAMRELGHSAELVYTSRDETLAAINTVVKSKNKPPFDGIADRMAFWKKWKEDNALCIINTLGIKGGPAKNRFLSGILVATSASKSIFDTTQEVVQADGAHTSFG